MVYLHGRNKHYSPTIYQMKKALSLFIILLPISLLAQPCKNLSTKEAFTIGFPQFYSFRGEMNKKTHVSYDTWKAEVENSNGIIRKFLEEEMKIDPNSVDWADNFAKDNPSKLMLLHLNGEAHHVVRDPDILKKYFPGHWLYEAGSILTQNALPNQNELQVEDIAPFLNRRYLGGNGEGKGFNKNNSPEYILIVKLDDKGNRMWYESEMAEIIKIDSETKKLTIKRNVCNTKSLSFDANKTYVAPIAGGVWGGGVMFFYNMSSDCPKDKNGKVASDIFVDEIANWFSPKGILKNFNGIAFDVNYYDISARFPKSDTNNDGINDGGWINNQNNWKIGDYQFHKKLRNKMGNNFIITSDGQHAENQQAVGVLNGIESEGLVQHNDGWRGFSRTINLHQYWEHNNSIQPTFRYIVLKYMNSNDATNVVRLQRFAVGTACCLKAFTTEARDNPERSFLPDWMRKPGALGQAKGEIIHYAKQSPDILNKSITELKDMIIPEDCSVKVVNNQLEITPNSSLKNARDLNLTLKNIELPQGDITIFIDAQAVDPSEGLSLTDLVPRIMWTTLSDLPDYGEGKNTNVMYNNLTGLFGTSKFDEMSFYYRRPTTDASKTADFTMRIQGRGKIIIRSIKIYPKADIVARKFDHGFVIVNPSFDNLKVNLSDFGLKNEIIEVPAVDANFVKY